jgi:hypothetical protein
VRSKKNKHGEQVIFGCHGVDYLLSVALKMRNYATTKGRPPALRGRAFDFAARQCPWQPRARGDRASQHIPPQPVPFHTATEAQETVSCAASDILHHLDFGSSPRPAKGVYSDVSKCVGSNLLLLLTDGSMAGPVSSGVR